MCTHWETRTNRWFPFLLLGDARRGNRWGEGGAGSIYRSQSEAARRDSVNMRWSTPCLLERGPRHVTDLRHVWNAWYHIWFLWLCVCDGSVPFSRSQSYPVVRFGEDLQNRQPASNHHNDIVPSVSFNLGVCAPDMWLEGDWLKLRKSMRGNRSHPLLRLSRLFLLIHWLHTHRVIIQYANETLL